MALPRQIYLGDAVYAERDEDFGDLILTREDGQVTHRIILQPEVWEALMLYMEVKDGS